MGAGRSNGLRVVPESWAKLSKVEQSWAKSSNVKQCQAMSSNVKQCQAKSISTVSTFTQKSDFEHPLHH